MKYSWERVVALAVSPLRPYLTLVRFQSLYGPWEVKAQDRTSLLFGPEVSQSPTRKEPQKDSWLAVWAPRKSSALLGKSAKESQADFVQHS